MEKSTEKDEQHLIKLYGVYGFTKNVKNGISLVVLSQDDRKIGGLKWTQNNWHDFSTSRSNFENLLLNGTIEYIEVIPEEIRTELLRVYKS